MHHSYIVKGQEGKDLYQIGRPVASGGHLTIKDGKITSINNSSGHYQPTYDQQKLMIYKLLNHDVIHSNAEIIEHGFDSLFLTELPEIYDVKADYGGILNNYIEFKGFDYLDNILLGDDSNI